MTSVAAEYVSFGIITWHIRINIFSLCIFCCYSCHCKYMIKQYLTKYLCVRVNGPCRYKNEQLYLQVTCSISGDRWSHKRGYLSMIPHRKIFILAKIYNVSMLNGFIRRVTLLGKIFRFLLRKSLQQHLYIFQTSITSERQLQICLMSGMRHYVRLRSWTFKRGAWHSVYFSLSSVLCIVYSWIRLKKSTSEKTTGYYSCSSV